MADLATAEPGTRQYLVAMAEAWRAAGCVVHPAKSDGSKVPAPVNGGGLETYAATFPDVYLSGPRKGQPHPRAGEPNPQAGQHTYGWKRLGTGELAYPWPGVLSLLRSKHDGIGVFCGAVSGGLEMVELEGRAAHLVEVLEHTAADRGVLELWHRFNDGCSETTPAGGIHWYLRVAGMAVPGNTKLAMRPNPDEPAKPACFAETRGTGGWVVVAGSFGRTHATGKPYVLRTGSPATIPTFTPDEHAAIHELFRTLDEMPELTRPAGTLAVVAKRERPDGELLPGDDFDQRGTWAEVMPTSWAKLSTGTVADAWSMHGRSGRKTADHYHGNDRLFIYDTECPGSQKSLTKFSAYAWLNHNGDFGAAASALYAAGYGSRREKKKHGGVEIEPPPGRVEIQPERETVSLDDLRDGLRADLARAVADGARLVVCTPEPGVGKTTAAVETLAGAFDRLLWVVATHDAAAETVGRLHAAGHMDAAAIPPRDETTCQCWTADDAARLRTENPAFPHVLPMVDAMRVGNPHLACLACPLSGLQKASAAVLPVDDFAAWADPFADTVQNPQNEDSAPAPDADGCRCEYWRRKRDADAARITVMCQARYLKAVIPPAPIGTTRAIVIDEHGTDAMLPRQRFDLKTIRGTRDAMSTAVDNWRNRKNKMRWGQAREREHELLKFAEAVVRVADGIVSHMEGLEAAGNRVVQPLPWLAIGVAIPKRAHTKLSRLLIQGGLPDSFDAAALDLVRRVAAGLYLERTAVYVEPVPGGTHRAQIVVADQFTIGANAGENICPQWESLKEEWQALEREHAKQTAGNYGQSSTFVFDASADMDAIRKAFPEVVEISPAGAAPLAVDAVQWWFEINPATHPVVVVSMLERAIHERGFKSAGVILCKSHRDVLFPVTRPRGARRGEDKEPDAERIANWGGRGGRELSSGTAEQRLARARELVERVRHLRQFIARDEYGRLLVEHHRGAGSRGTNKFLIGTDGGVVLGQSRCPPGEVAAYMLGTGRGDAVRASNGTWGDVEGELPAVGGGVTKRRWRGYACPEWDAAARQTNRAALTQVCERFRTRLKEIGVPVVLVATEWAGLPVTDPPATIPEGVAAVVGAVRELSAAGRCEDGQTVAGGVSTGQPCTGHGVPGVGSMRQPSTEHDSSRIVLGGWRIETGATLAAIVDATGLANRSVQRWLADAVARGLLTRTGSGRWTRYGIPVPGQVSEMPPPAPIVVGQADELPPADLEHANAMFAEAAAEAREPRPRRSSRTTPNAPNAPAEPRRGWPSTRPATPRTVPVPAVLAALGRARDELRARPEWNDPATWATVRGIIPPDAARAEVERMDAGLPPGVPVVRRE